MYFIFNLQKGVYIMKVAGTSASGKPGAAIVKQLLKQLSKEQIVAIARNTE
jgi:uridine kinase